eukprot:SM000386S14578  [mRNA]  locus=s386:11944:13846:- [translate_table: standard]
MPRYYCDYCDTYLTHDSPSVRKQHNAGYKHKANVRQYYQQFEEQQTQSLIDQKVKEHLSAGGVGGPFSPVGGGGGGFPHHHHLHSLPPPPGGPMGGGYHHHRPMPMPLPMPMPMPVPGGGSPGGIRPPVLPPPGQHGMHGGPPGPPGGYGYGPSPPGQPPHQRPGPPFGYGGPPLGSGAPPQASAPPPAGSGMPGPPPATGGPQVEQPNNLSNGSFSSAPNGNYNPASTA